jgi:hypothetical protein
MDRIQGIFAIVQNGEILTVRATRDGEDWMRLNPRQEEQRWALLNSQVAFLSNSLGPERQDDVGAVRVARSTNPVS